MNTLPHFWKTFALAALPLLLTVGIAGTAAVLAQTGHNAFAERILGPLSLIASGWTILGFMGAAGMYGRIFVLEDSRSGPKRLLGIALLGSVVLLGAALIVLGIWLLL
jgi:Na+/proline symporter